VYGARLHSKPSSGQSSALVQERVQKPDLSPELVVNTRQLSVSHSAAAVQVAPNAFLLELPEPFVPEPLEPPFELDEVDVPVLESSPQAAADNSPKNSPRMAMDFENFISTFSLFVVCQKHHERCVG
jgi:hypothetical protein